MRAPLPSIFSRPHRLLIAALLLFVGLVATGCEFTDDDAPDILTVEVIPSSITVEEIGASPQSFFEVEISTVNFDDEITDAGVFIEDQDRYAVAELVVDDNIVRLEEISNHWFQGFEPGIYNIGAEVDSDTAFTRQFNVTTVEVTE